MPILMYRISTVYVPYINRISTVVDSGRVAELREMEAPTRKREKSYKSYLQRVCHLYFDVLRNKLPPLLALLVR